MFDMNSMMGKVQEAQERLKKAQNTLVNITAEGNTGAGIVIAKVNGKKQVIALEIDESILNINDKEMLQDLTIAAINKALETIEPLIADHLAKSTEGLLPNIPGFDISNFMGK